MRKVVIDGDIYEADTDLDFCELCGHKLEFGDWQDDTHIWLNCPLYFSDPSIDSDEHTSFLVEVKR